MDKKQPPKTTLQKIGNVFVPIPLIVALFIGVGCLFAAKGHSLDGIINNSYLSGIGLGMIIMFFVFMIYSVVHELRQ